MNGFIIFLNSFLMHSCLLEPWVHREVAAMTSQVVWHAIWTLSVWTHSPTRQWQRSSALLQTGTSPKALMLHLLASAKWLSKLPWRYTSRLFCNSCQHPRNPTTSLICEILRELSEAFCFARTAFSRKIRSFTGFGFMKFIECSVIVWLMILIGKHLLFSS